MSVRVDPTLLTELKRYGAVNVEACFNCGNCTAICPLSTNTGDFPRRIIRYVQMGMKDRLLGSKELWMCYACGQCTTTCPRQADPGGFMAAARRYAIASYDRLGLARILYTSPILSVIFLMIMVVLFGAYMMADRYPIPAGPIQLFAFVPAERVHDLGLGVMAIVGVAAVAGVVTMAVSVGRSNGILGGGKRFNWFGALWETLGVEVLGQRRYRGDCEASDPRRPWYLRQWFVHASILWGFLGLLAATALDYLLALLGVKPTGTWVPIWEPIRLLGTISGILLVYGTSVAILKRVFKTDVNAAASHFSDWAFLVLLWLSGVSGMVLELSLYLPSGPTWGYALLIAHIAVAMAMLLVAPFTKFAHALYRSIALYVHALRPVEEVALAGAPTGD